MVLYINHYFNQLFFIFGLYHEFFPIIELYKPEKRWEYIFFFIDIKYNGIKKYFEQ